MKMWVWIVRHNRREHVIPIISARLQEFTKVIPKREARPRRAFGSQHGRDCWDLRSISLPNFDQNIDAMEYIESYIENIQAPTENELIIYYV